jgi:hypothetical protein
MMYDKIEILLTRLALMTTLRKNFCSFDNMVALTSARSDALVTQEVLLISCSSFLIVGIPQPG